MLRQDISMLSGSAHWDLIEANDRPVLPSAGPPKASRTATRRPARLRWWALLAPITPAPITATSAPKSELIGAPCPCRCRRDPTLSARRPRRLGAEAEETGRSSDKCRRCFLHDPGAGIKL